jgi:hypothetical protein
MGKIEAARVSARTPDADESWNVRELRRPDRLLNLWLAKDPAGSRDSLSVMINSPLNVISFQAREESL